MLDLSAVPSISLKGAFFIHFVFITAALGSFWTPSSYQFYNVIFLITILWSIHSKESEEPVGLACNVNLICLVWDIYVVIFHFSDAYHLGAGFSYIMAFLNLLFRPISSLSLYRVSQERNPLVDPLPSQISRLFNNCGIAESGTIPNPYQDIDSMPHQSVPRNNFSPTVYHT